MDSPGIGENGRFTNEEAYKMEIITYEIQSYHKSMACDIMRGGEKIYCIDLNFVYETFFLSGLHLPLLAQVEIRITNTP